MWSVAVLGKSINKRAVAGRMFNRLPGMSQLLHVTTDWKAKLKAVMALESVMEEKTILKAVLAVPSVEEAWLELIQPKETHQGLLIHWREALAVHWLSIQKLDAAMAHGGKKEIRFSLSHSESARPAVLKEILERLTVMMFAHMVPGLHALDIQRVDVEKHGLDWIGMVDSRELPQWSDGMLSMMKPSFQFKGRTLVCKLLPVHI